VNSGNSTGGDYALTEEIRKFLGFTARQLILLKYLHDHENRSKDLILQKGAVL